MKTILAILLTLTSYTAVSQTPDTVLTIKTTAEVRANIGRRVTLIGRYGEVRVNKKPDAAPVFQGYAAIVLDSSYVLLKDSGEARRAKEEIELCRNKRVQVTGILAERCNLWGDGNTATIVNTCLSDTKDLKLIPEDTSGTPQARAALDTIMAQWRRAEYRTILARNKITMDCGGCINVYMDVEMTINADGKLVSHKKINENKCGGKFTPKLEKEFLQYFYKLKFPPELRNSIITLRLGTGLMC